MCGLCGRLIGPFNVTLGSDLSLLTDNLHSSSFGNSPNLYGPDFLAYLNQFDEYDELSLSEDGTLSLSGRRRSLNQCY